MYPEQCQLRNSEAYLGQPSGAAEYCAGRLYALPNDTDQHIQRLQRNLNYYRARLGNESNQLTLEHTVNRALCMATAAPIYHLIELEADRRFLNAFDGRFLDTVAYVDGLDDYVPPITLNDEYAEFARFSGMVNSWAVDRVLKQVQDSTNPYHKTWQYFGSFLPDFAATEARIRGYQRPTDPIVAVRQVFNALGTDNALPFLMQVVFQFWEKRDLRGAGITEELLCYEEELSWGARTRRSFFGQHFPSEQIDATLDCPYKPTGKNTFTDGSWGNHGALWVNPSLDSLSNLGGFCPAAVELTSPVEEGRLLIEAMFEAIARHTRSRLQTRLYGTAMAAELSLIRSILLLDRTIIKRFQ
jgi:hypothetical protein